MNPSDQALIEHACTRLMIGYCLHADHGDAEKFAGLFTEDGVWVQGNGKEVRGRAALLRHIKERPQPALKRHVITNMSVDVLDGDHAKGIAYALAFQDVAWSGTGPGQMPAANALIEYHDEFRRDADGWRIARRITMPIFRS